MHFAVKDKPKDETSDSIVYVLEPYGLMEQIEALPEFEALKTEWKAYAHLESSDGIDEDDWPEAYLPGDEEELKEFGLPRIPMFLRFPHITRRVAAQRSRFMVFGTDPAWLATESRKEDSLIQAITIDGSSSYGIRTELRDCGITESVIFPDLDGLGREIKQLWQDRK